ncbi:MAG: sensor histidine kinase [Acidimicrobiales bacterium]
MSIVMAAALFQVVRDFTAHYRSSVVRDLAEEPTEYAKAASLRPAGQSIEAFTRSYISTHVLPADHLLVVGFLGQPSLGSAGAVPLARAGTVAGWLAHPPPGTVSSTVFVAGEASLALATPIRTGGRTVGVLVSAADLEHLSSERNRVLVLAGTEAAAAVLVAMASAYLLLRRVLYTVGAVTEAAAEASEGDLRARLDDQGAEDEVGRLARTFNSMLERISAGVEAQRRLLSDVSHQLRTPLTVARGHLEVLNRSANFDRAEVTETAAVVIDELERMGLLVNRLLLLGRALEPDFLEIGRVDLRSFVADIFESAKVLADRQWSLAHIPDAVILVDEEKLRGALLNLIDNAVKATTQGDLIGLRASCADEVVLSVADSGRGIPPEVQADVFDRFRRADAPGTRGVGLGLAIVRAVAEAHGGRVELSSALGVGTEISVILPPRCMEGSGGPLEAAL